MLVHTLVSAGCIGVDIAFDLRLGADVIYGIVSLLPLFAIVTRRLHDIQRSGWWGWLFFCACCWTVHCDLLAVFAKPASGGCVMKKKS
ncbi:DUF805 domain-containing protein [Vibrio sinaloensis]|nr:DUF805 domain-containing protein [Vibrio sinaloensis]